MFCLSLARQGFAELVKTTFPELPTAADPCVEVSEGCRTKRIKPLLAFRSHTHQGRFLQNAEMPRYAGLVNIDVLNDVIDRMLAAQEHLHDVEPGWVG